MRQLTKYQSPLETPATNLRREMDRIFNELVPFSWRSNEVESDSGFWNPRTDMIETDGEYLIEIDLPGMSKKDIQVNYQDNILTIEGERKLEHKEEKIGYLRNERYFGNFKRSIAMPVAIAHDKIKATFKEGVLKLNIPKAEKSKRKTVTID